MAKATCGHCNLTLAENAPKPGFLARSINCIRCGWSVDVEDNRPADDEHFSPDHDTRDHEGVA